MDSNNNHFDNVIPKNSSNLSIPNNKKHDFVKRQKFQTKQNAQIKAKINDWFLIYNKAKHINDIFQKNDSVQSKNLQKPKKSFLNKQHAQFIKTVQNLIDQINSEPSDNFIMRLESEINTIKEMINTIITFKDSTLKETKTIMSIMKLFTNDLIINQKELNYLYEIFIENDDFIFKTKLNLYFNHNSNSKDLITITHFLAKLSDISFHNKKLILKLYHFISKSNQSLSVQSRSMIKEEINKLEAEINFFLNPKKIIFTDQIIFQKLNDTELTNNYKKPWTSLELYIKTMFNLSIENYMYPLRTHLNELKNGEMDPRDLRLYEKVTICPSFEFDEKMDFDIFIKFSIRENGQSIKIDWENTERLSFPNLLFFSLSPFMETIDAVATSSARKGTIKNNIIPISMLQGNIDVDKEYYMFEPIDNWNGPFFNNLLNTNQFTFPKTMVKPIIYLDFSDNLLKNNDSLFFTKWLFKDQNENQQNLMFQIQTENEDLKYYLNETSSIVKELSNKDESNKFLRSIYNDIINYLIFLEEKRGKTKSFNQNSLIVRNFCNHIKKYFNFQNVNEKWIFDDWKPEEFKEKCKVDHEQYKALRYSLNHHLTLVNGAPGTGKTYLASQLFEFLIQSGYEHQILVVTYKNVSLDGFLDNIAGFLKNNHVDFIRIGGKPRTENLYILQNRFDRQIPDEIIQYKKQYMYLLSFQILINDYLSNQSNNNLIRSIADEIDKLIHINKIMFNDFSFYSEEEELIIKNFFNPVDFIPFGSVYFNCWLFGTDYYESVQQSIKTELDKSYKSIFDELKNYFQKGENDPTTEIINEIIKRQFDGNEDEFQLFVNKKKKKIINEDFSLLSDIINNADEGFFNFNDNETDFSSDDSNYDDDKPDFKSETKISSSKLRDYIEYEASMFSEEFIKSIENKFNRLIAKTERKEESFKEFLIELKEIISTESTNLKEKYDNKKKEFEEKEDIDIIKELSTKKLIAMTATRASQYKKYIDLLDCQFMIIEEAGELTEPMAFSIIPKTIQNLLMIGDYRQLRPTVEYQLTFQPYNHHISLFEKEVIHAKKTKSDNLFTLSIQRRMHPQISLLLRRIFYSDKNDVEQLNDDESTNNLNKPFGFPNHIQFWLHECTEEMENLKMRSHVNIEEAQICAMLFLMMLCRGYKSSEVTIVPLYKGQKKQIEDELINLIDIYYRNEDNDVYDAFDFEKDLPSKIKVPEDFSQLIEFRKSLVGRYVKCIDDFQGEENEVIILSLTRSEKPGFVKNENRSLVALSRARQMLFVIGNKNVFGMQNEKNPLWQRITAEAFLIDKNSVHFDGIAVSKCPIHNKEQNDEVVIINQAIQFMDNRFNYCQEFCDQKCKCGHNCCLPCHLHLDPLRLEIFERRYYCLEECSKHCKLGHKCQGTCGNCTHNGCPPCSYPCRRFCSKNTCKKKCSLPCCHEGECCCMFKGRCSKCKNEIIDLHTKLMFWNDKILLCKDCFYKKLNTEKGKRAYARSSNKDEKFLIYGDDDFDLSDPDDYAEYLAYLYVTNHQIKDFY